MITPQVSWIKMEEPQTALIGVHQCVLCSTEGFYRITHCLCIHKLMYHASTYVASTCGFNKADNKALVWLFHLMIRWLPRQSLTFNRASQFPQPLLVWHNVPNVLLVAMRLFLFVLWLFYSYRLAVCPYTMQPMQGDWMLSGSWLSSVVVLWMPGILWEHA